MKKSWVVGFGLGAVALLASLGCNSAPPPAPDTKAAEAAVRKADADWVKAASTRKVEDWVAFYADDAVVLPPNDKTAKGKAAIAKPIGELLGLPELNLTWTPTAVEVAKSGELVYMYGAYQMSWKGPDGKPLTDTGKFAEIWKQQADGNWKCVLDTYSSDLPPAPAAAPPSK